MKHDIVLGGVGGQGILFTAEMIARAAMRTHKVLIAETHGMAQRGGSVAAHVRIGEVYGALVPEGQGDVLAGFEYMEAYRYLKFLKKGGNLIINTHRIKPVTLEHYPEFDYDLGAYKVLSFNATELAKKVGNVMVTNMVMLGAITRFSGVVAENDVRDVLKENVPAKFLKIDMKALEEGFKAVR